MSLYFIRTDIRKKASKYIISKMDDDFEVLDVYEAIVNEHHRTCSCPAYRPACKHLRMIDEWLNMPVVVRRHLHYNDKTRRWEEPPEGLQVGEDDGIQTLLRD